MNGAPLVSVVIPAYNAARFIERTLKSALRQTYRNLQILVIDDGSTDDTRSVAEAVIANDDRVRIISVPNGGVAKARNIGIAESTGGFVAFLDADDLWHPRKIELQLSTLLASSDDRAAAVYPFSRVIDLDDRVMGPANTFGCNGYVLARLLYAKFIGNGSSLLVCREAAVRVGGYESSWAARGIGGCEDLDFELKLAAEHRLVVVPRFLVGYRVYKGNMSSDGSRMARAILATIEHHVRANPALPAWAAAAALGSAREYACSLLLRDRYKKRALKQFAALARCDAARALGFFRATAARKVRKVAGAKEEEPLVDGRFFMDIDLAETGVSPNAVSARDRINLQKLSALDAVLEANVPMERLPLPDVAATGYS